MDFPAHSGGLHLPQGPDAARSTARFLSTNDIARALRALGPVAVPSLANQVAGFIVDAIRSGIFPVGSTLPSERDLAESLRVSRKVLRDALEALRAHQVIEVTRGRSGGSVVASLRGVAPLLSEIYDGNAESLRDLHQVRRIIEREACRSAALRITESDCAELRRILAEADTALTDFLSYQEYTVQFHVRIGMLSGNPTLAGMIRSIANQISIAARGTNTILAIDVRKRNQEMLHDLLDAMVCKDLARIDELVDFHIDLIVRQFG